MTIEEAVIKMKLGVKITHKTFMPYEWICMHFQPNTKRIGSYDDGVWIMFGNYGDRVEYYDDWIKRIDKYPYCKDGYSVFLEN